MNRIRRFFPAFLMIPMLFGVSALSEIILSETFDRDGPISEYENWTGWGDVVDHRLRSHLDQGGYVSLGTNISSGQIYFSVDVDLISLGDYAGVSFFDSTGPTLYEKAFFGSKGIPGKYLWGLFGGRGAAGGGVCELGRIYRLVGCYDFDYLENDQPSPTCRIWVDPDWQEGVTAPLAEMHGFIPGGITRLRLQAGESGAAFFDNLIVGTSWADVVEKTGTHLRFSRFSPSIPLFLSIFSTLNLSFTGE